MIILFIILVAIINAIITLTTDYEKYFYPFASILPKPKSNGWIFISMNLLIIILAAGQYFYQDYLERTKETESDSKKKASDAILFGNYKKSLDTLEMKRENTDTVLFKMFRDAGVKNELLAKANEDIKKGVDKLKNDTSLKLSEPRPTVYLTSGQELILDSIVKKVYFFTVNTSSDNATSTGFNLTISLLIYNNLQGYSHKAHFKFLSDLVTIPKDKAYYTGFTFSNLVQPELLYVWLRGTFQNENRTKTYPPINFLYVYNFDTKKTQSVFAPPEFDKITGIISSHE